MEAVAALGAAAGYVLAQIPPYHNRAKGKASVLVLGCIDPRFSNDLAWYLTHCMKLHADYDLITMAGAEVGVFHSECWKEMFLQHIDLAIKLHGISEIWCFSHLDCGMYKAALGLDKDDKPQVHLEQMGKLRNLLAEKYPQLGFLGHIISVSGHIEVVQN